MSEGENIKGQEGGVPVMPGSEGGEFGGVPFPGESEPAGVPAAAPAVETPAAPAGSGVTQPAASEPPVVEPPKFQEPTNEELNRRVMEDPEFKVLLKKIETEGAGSVSDEELGRAEHWAQERVLNQVRAEREQFARNTQTQQQAREVLGRIQEGQKSVAAEFFSGVGRGLSQQQQQDIVALYNYSESQGQCDEILRAFASGDGETGKAKLTAKLTEIAGRVASGVPSSVPVNPGAGANLGGSAPAGSARLAGVNDYEAYRNQVQSFVGESEEAKAVMNEQFPLLPPGASREEKQRQMEQMNAFLSRFTPS